MKDKTQSPRRSGSRAKVKQLATKINAKIVEEYDKITPNRTQGIEAMMVAAVIAHYKTKNVHHSFMNNKTMNKSNIMDL